MSATRGTCRSCGAEVIWCTTHNNKSMPLDAVPNPKGTIVITTEGEALVATFLKKKQLQQVAEQPRYVSHFATCPQRAEWHKNEA